MKTFPIIKEDGSMHAFEIGNTFVTPRSIAKLLQEKDGVSAVQYRRFGSSKLPAEKRVVFEFHEVPYVVSEDWGDSSRYWIGPQSPTGPSRVAELEEHFRLASIPINWKILFVLIAFVYFVFQVLEKSSSK